MEKAENKDFKSKWDNYWYYYKYHTMLAAFAVIVIILIIVGTRTKDTEVDMTLMDATVLLNGDNMDKLLTDFAKAAGKDEESIVCNYTSDYVDEQVAERTGAKSIARALGQGELECVFTLRGKEYISDYIGNIENILSEELIETLGDDVMAGYLEEKDGALVETDVPAGIIVNDAPRFKETFGEIDDYIVLQIPENCQNQDDAVAFVKYLFDIQ